MSKPKTQAQLDREADRRLLKTYGITLIEFGRLLEVNDSKCWICDRPQGDKRLHVDHDHKVSKVKVVTHKDGVFWRAEAHYGKHHVFCHPGLKRSEVVGAVRKELKRLSIRGLCCWKCNSGLQRFADDEKRLRNAAVYLLHFEAGATARILAGQEAA